MAVLESVKRSARLAGSCQEWIPIVRENLSVQGFKNIQTDVSNLRLTADYIDSGIMGMISICLSQSTSFTGTNVSVVATASLGNTSALDERGTDT